MTGSVKFIIQWWSFPFKFNDLTSLLISNYICILFRLASLVSLNSSIYIAVFSHFSSFEIGQTFAISHSLGFLPKWCGKLIFCFSFLSRHLSISLIDLLPLYLWKMYKWSNLFSILLYFVLLIFLCFFIFIFYLIFIHFFCFKNLCLQYLLTGFVLYENELGHQFIRYLILIFLYFCYDRAW